MKMGIKPWKVQLYEEVVHAENPEYITRDAVIWIVTLHQNIVDNDKPIPVEDRALGMGKV